MYIKAKEIQVGDRMMIDLIMTDVEKVRSYPCMYEPVELTHKTEVSHRRGSTLYKDDQLVQVIRDAASSTCSVDSK